MQHCKIYPCDTSVCYYKKKELSIMCKIHIVKIFKYYIAIAVTARSIARHIEIPSQSRYLHEIVA